MQNKEIQQLVLENGKLKKENKKLLSMQIKPCSTCENLKRHDCYVLWVCPYLGFVDPEKDGCTKHQGGNK